MAGEGIYNELGHLGVRVYICVYGIGSRVRGACVCVGLWDRQGGAVEWGVPVRACVAYVRGRVAWESICLKVWVGKGPIALLPVAALATAGGRWVELFLGPAELSHRGVMVPSLDSGMTHIHLPGESICWAAAS